MADQSFTLAGNLTADPELRFTPSGAAVASFTVAHTPRFLNRTTNEWEDGDALFMRCNVWRQQAENLAESLQRGMRVIVTGNLKQRSFETREGEKRTVIELDVQEVAASLKFATVNVKRAQRADTTDDSYDEPDDTPPPRNNGKRSSTRERREPARSR
jgi:single-strand DNA-binding protein